MLYTVYGVMYYVCFVTNGLHFTVTVAVSVSVAVTVTVTATVTVYCVVC